ncbi:hypothetical protein B7P43_G18069, partial [Cryptotermes secundus]
SRTPQSGGKLHSQSDLLRRVFLEEMSCRRYNKKKCEDQKEHHGYKIGTWNVRTLNPAGKLEYLKTEMQKNEVHVLGVSEMRWKGQGEIRSGDYTVYYSRGERAERGVAIVVHKSVVRSVVKKIVCNDRIIALKLKAEPVDILIMQVYMPTSEYEDDEVEKVLTKFRTRLKKIIRFQKRRPRWDLEKLYAQRQSVQETLEQKLGAIESESGNAEVQWNNIKECMLDTISDLMVKLRRYHENHGLHRR